MNLQKKFENWPEPNHPPFSDIKEIGCYPEHEGGFNWYRQHTWEDLKDLILSAEEILEETLDPYEFGSLRPKVHHYFIKGVLSSLAQKVMIYQSFEEIDDWDWQWIKYISHHLKKSKFFHPENLPCYSKVEVESIIELLEGIQKKFTLDPKGLYYKGDKEIKSTLDDWKLFLTENYS